MAVRVRLDREARNVEHDPPDRPHRAADRLRAVE
jgi:hypothetical protein